MIIVDLSQVMLSNIMVQLGNHTNAQVDENMVRHMVLNSLRLYKSKFGAEYGELIIACDNKNYWRRKLFPYYKASRKKNIENSELNWKAIFDCLGKLRAELKDHFAYRIIDIESAEADDIIAVLCREYSSDENIMILSGDKDFIQLQQYPNVKQYDPVRKKAITHPNPVAYRNEHIMKGDTGDGVPNILSPDNCFVVGERQKPLTQKKIDKYLSGEPMSAEVARNYARNRQLIDLSMVPTDISEKIIESYESQQDKKPKDLVNYFIANRLKNLMENIQEFA